MKIRLSLIILMLPLCMCGFTQQLAVENTFEFKSLKKNSYLGKVEYNAANKTTSLYYVENDMTKTIFTTYIFDDKLNFLQEKSDAYTIADAMNDAFKDLHQQFRWFNYKGESYTKQAVWVTPNLKGEIIARKVEYTYNFNWNLGTYLRTFKVLEKQAITGIDGERLYLYNRIDNSRDGSVLLLVGLRPEKGDKTNKYQEARKFQFIKITNDFNAIPGDLLDFEFNMGISFVGALSNNAEIIETEGNDEMSGISNMMSSPVGDLADGKAVLVFVPVKSLLVKAGMNPDPRAQTFVILDENGKVEKRLDYESPSSGWAIEGYILSENKNDIYLFGPAIEGSYVNMVTPMNTPLGSGEITGIKWKNFQLMKVHDGTLEFLTSTNLDEFEAKAVNPPSQTKSPDYRGKNFEKAMAYVTPAGEVIISGQKYNLHTVPGTTSTPTSPAPTFREYTDIVMFHFDTKGVLKAQYGIRRENNNSYAKAFLTPQDIYVTKDGNSMYWIYGEIQGMRKGFDIETNIAGFSGSIGISKRKLLYYPAVAKVDLTKGSITDFVALGIDKDGKQKYFTNPEFPQLLSDDQSALTFIGEDRPGKIVWFGRMKLD